MATATLKQPEPTPTTFVLELNEEEALYVYGALQLVDPTEEASFSYDVVFDALDAALDSTGVDYSGRPNLARAH